MPKFAKHLNSLVAGELSPRFYGRTDADQYSQGAREITNCIVRPQGGAARRPGSVFVSDGIKDPSQSKFGFGGTAIRLIDFRFSRNEAALVVLQATTNGATLNPLGIMVYVPSIKQWVTPTISFPIQANYYRAFNFWTTQAELDEIQYAQTGDILVLVSRRNPPIYLRRTGIAAYEIVDIYALREQTNPIFASQRYKDYSGTDVNVQAKITGSPPPSSGQPYYNVPYTLATSNFGTVSASGTTGDITLTFSLQKPGGFKGTPGLNGTIVRITKNGTTGFVRVNSTSGFDASCTVLKPLGATGVQDAWEYQSFGVGGNGLTWPRAVAFHDQRLWFANGGDYPNAVWASQVGDYTELMITRPAEDAKFGTISNDRPFSYNLASNQVNDIKWMLSAQSSLFIGTAGAEWIGLPSSDNILGPLNPNFSVQTTYGSKDAQAMIANGSTIFVDRTGQHLREFIFNRDIDNYRAVDLNYFADHLIRKAIDLYPSTYNYPEIKFACVQQGQNNSIWALDNNYSLHALTKERDYGTLAWSSIQFGGYADAGQTIPPRVRAMVTLPNDTANDDDVYVIVERYLGGATRYYLEKIGMEFLGPSLNETSQDIQRLPVFQDAAVQIFNLSGPKMFARYNSAITLDYWTTSAAGTATGSPVIDSTGLSFISETPTLKYVAYDPANATLVQTGTIVVDFTPNYNGTPSSDQHILAISKTTSDLANSIRIYHAASDGSLTFDVRDSAGASFGYIPSFVFAPIAGQTYQITCSFDATKGYCRLYVNGVLKASYGGAQSPLTRTATIGNFVVGTDYTRVSTANFSIRRLGIATSALPTTWGTTDSNQFTNKDVFKFAAAFAFGTYVMGTGHLYGAGEVLGDGVYQGSIDLRSAQLPAALTNTGITGLKYVSRIVSLDVEAGSIIGSAQGEVRRPHEVTVRMERSAGLKYGSSSSQLYDVQFPLAATAGQPIPLYTGDHLLKYPPGYDRFIRMVFQQDLPLPCTITSIILRGLTYD